MKNLIFALTFLFSAHAFSQDWDVVTHASSSEGFPAGARCYFSNSKIVTFKKGIVLRYTCLGGEELYNEAWFIKGKESKLIARSELGHLFNEPVIHAGKIFIAEYSECGTTKLIEHDLVSQKVHGLPQGPAINMHDMASLGSILWFRYSDEEGIHGEGTFQNGQFTRAPAKDVSYFFGGGSSNRMFVQKVRHGEQGEFDETQPDEIQIRMAPDYSPKTVAKDRDTDPSSPIISFYNFSVVQGDRWLVIAKTNDGIVALLGQNAASQMIPLYKSFKALDFWAPALTKKGEIYLRGEHLDGRKGLWQWNAGTPKLTIKESVFYTAPVSDGTSLFIGLGLDENSQSVVKLPTL